MNTGKCMATSAFVGTNPQLTFTFECPSSSRNRALALANFAGVSRS
jgi:hypothetical protein